MNDMEINKLTVNCINSNESAFSIDSEGNIIGKSIQLIDPSSSGTNISFTTLVDMFYPIGSIYQSTNYINPSDLFGGTWEAFSSGRALVGVDANDTDFNTVKKTGGAKTHTLTVAQMPSHKHNLILTGGSSPTGSRLSWTGSSTYQSYPSVCDPTGGGGAHNNLQPYITCYIWQRIA